MKKRASGYVFHGTVGFSGQLIIFFFFHFSVESEIKRVVHHRMTTCIKSFSYNFSTVSLTGSDFWEHFRIFQSKTRKKERKGDRAASRHVRVSRLKAWIYKSHTHTHRRFFFLFFLLRKSPTAESEIKKKDCNQNHTHGTVNRKEQQKQLSVPSGYTRPLLLIVHGNQD